MATVNIIGSLELNVGDLGNKELTAFIALSLLPVANFYLFYSRSQNPLFLVLSIVCFIVTVFALLMSYIIHSKIRESNEETYSYDDVRDQIEESYIPLSWRRPRDWLIWSVVLIVVLWPVSIYLSLHEVLQVNRLLDVALLFLQIGVFLWLFAPMLIDEDMRETIWSLYEDVRNRD